MTDAYRVVDWLIKRWRASGPADNDDASAGDIMAALKLTREQFEEAAQQLEARGLVQVDGFLGDDDGTPNLALVLTEAAKQ